MGPIEAFNATWSQARATMGEGAPQDGSALDNSAQLRQMQSQVQAAAPGERWTGAAADAYADANDGQARRLGQLAELDQQLAAEVSRSAQAVTAGRQNLDSIQQWVNEAAASLPDSGDPEQQLPIARKGISEVADVVRQTHGELNTIGQRIQNIGQQYSTLAGGRPNEEFDLDTQYARPAGLTAPPPASGAQCVTAATAVTGTIYTAIQTVNITATWTGASNGRHCKK
jgi:uncharacterized protein YukE